MHDPAHRCVGFTGTRQGMTERQRRQYRRMMRELKEAGYDCFHHGDCVGADEQAADDAREIGFRIVCHPPTERRLRAFTDYDELRYSASYLRRNEQIVREVEIMLAAPRQRHQPRSLRGQGTWWTIVEARRRGKPPVMLMP